MSAYVKIMLAVATLACRDAGLLDRPELLRDSSAVLGTMHGSSGFCHEYYSQIVREGVLAANPMLFAEGVPNVGAAQLSLMLGLRGGCQSIIGTRTAGLDALRFAYLRIASGASDRVIVGAAEESHDVVNRAYEECGLKSVGPSEAPFAGPSGFRSSAGGAAMILESREAAQARDAMVYATIERALSQFGDREELPRSIARVLDGSASTILPSANATWIDRAESHAIQSARQPMQIEGFYAATGEVFSATPLLGIIATLLRGQRREFTSLCSDWSGCASAVTLRARALANPARSL
jgi:acetyl-CoA acetyltransferase